MTNEDNKQIEQELKIQLEDLIEIISLKYNVSKDFIWLKIRGARLIGDKINLD